MVEINQLNTLITNTNTSIQNINTILSNLSSNLQGILNNISTANGGSVPSGYSLIEDSISFLSNTTNPQISTMSDSVTTCGTITGVLVVNETKYTNIIQTTSDLNSKNALGNSLTSVHNTGVSTFDSVVDSSIVNTI